MRTATSSWTARSSSYAKPLPTSSAPTATPRTSQVTPARLSPPLSSAKGRTRMRQRDIDAALAELRKAKQRRPPKRRRKAPLTLPGIEEFIKSDAYLNRPNVYPRQLTFLKIMFLRSEEFSSYDEDVIAELITEFERTGNHGIQPDIATRIE